MKQLLKTIAKTLPLLLLAVLAAFVLPELAHAAEPTGSEDVEKTIAKLLTIGVDFLNALLWPFLLIIGDLMDTDMILGPGMEEKLKGIWIPVRDLVNIGFVLVLLVVAFYNVLGIGGGEGDLALKTALPKIVLGLVLVNFTFIGGKVVLDLVNVATTAAFALPELASDESPYDFSGVKEEFRQKVCYKSVDEATGIAFSWTATNEEEEKEIPIYTRLFCTKADDGTYDELDGLLAAQYFTDLNSNNIGLVMAVNMGGLSSLSVLKAESIDSFSDLTISILFALVMYLVFATSYLVLGIVLLTRIIVLWIALALSPLAVLVYVVPQIKEWAGGGGDFSQKIIKTLLAPVIIGLTMSLGYIMIDAWDGNLALDGGGFKANEVISKEFLIEGMDDLPQFIIALASILIVWTGVFAAASDTYASFATEAIKGFGERVRDAALKAPTLLPTVPVGIKGGEPQTVSFAALKGLADQGLRQIEYGTGVDEEMQNLANNNPIAKMLLGNGRGEQDPRKNGLNIQDTLAKVDRDKNLLSSDASQIARDLYNSIEKKSTASDKAALLEEVKKLQRDYELGTETSFEPLRKILGRSAADLGIEDASVYRNVQDRARDVNRVVAAPAAPLPTANPTATAAKTAVDQATATGATAAQVTSAVTAVDALATTATATTDATLKAQLQTQLQAEAARLAPVLQAAATTAMANATAVPPTGTKAQAVEAATVSQRIATASGDTTLITAATDMLRDANALP